MNAMRMVGRITINLGIVKGKVNPTSNIHHSIRLRKRKLVAKIRIQYDHSSMRNRMS